MDTKEQKDGKNASVAGIEASPAPTKRSRAKGTELDGQSAATEKSVTTKSAEVTAPQATPAKRSRAKGKALDGQGAATEQSVATKGAEVAAPQTTPAKRSRAKGKALESQGAATEKSAVTAVKSTDVADPSVKKAKRSRSKAPVLADPQVAQSTQVPGKKSGIENSIERGDEVEQKRQADHQTEKAGQAPEKQTTDKLLAKDASFMDWLKLRMKTSEWGKYIPGSKEFDGIDKDLRKLGKDSPEVARDIWKENTPPGTKLPDYLTPGKEKSSEHNQHQKDGELDKVKTFKVPEEIKRRYLAAENKFYYRDAKNQLAFEDRGQKMVTEHNDPEVAKSLVEMAEAKGWTKIKAAGHEDFKREVWMQATLKGIEVDGYKPKDVDLAKLREMQSARAKNSVERDEGRDITTPAKGKGQDKNGSEKEAKEAIAPSNDRGNLTTGQEKDSNLKGKLLDHGKAAYEFNAKNERSYFVQIETENGVRTHWGVDLGRAVDEAGTKIGEMIELERMGKKPVSVQEKKYDENGKLLGHIPVETERVEWRVGGLEQSKSAAKVADVVVKGATTKSVDIEKEKPTPSASKESHTPKPMDAAEVSARNKGGPLTSKEADKAKLDIKGPLKSDKEPAIQLKGDFKIPVAVFGEVLREKGYSPKTIQRAQDEATKRLGLMVEKGQQAPGVKVYDRNADRERPREKIVSKAKEKQQERNR